MRRLSEKTLQYRVDSLDYVRSGVASIKQELRFWLNGNALKHIDEGSVRRILERCEAIFVLAGQELEDRRND